MQANNFARRIFRIFASKFPELNPIKQLAGQTAIYGLSSIVARIINFFFVPLYTRIISTGNYGLFSELMGYIALLQVVLTLGLETGFLRYANKEKDRASQLFSTALVTLSFVSLLLVAGIWLVAPSLGKAMGHPPLYLIYVALILAFDAITAIFFAQLRFEQRPWNFALLRSIKIISEVVFNLLLFFALPPYLARHPDSFILNFIPATPDYGYILLAIMLSGVVAMLLFLPRLLRTSFKFSGSLWKKLMVYSLPLMIAGLPGVANDFIDRPLFRFFAPGSSPWQDQLGVYNAVMKLAVFMVLFVQMFRYAAEPFFFASAEKKDIRQTYADVMKYFVAFCILIFLGIVLYADIFALILGKDYRSGMGVLPIVLISNILLGITFNLSMWYKLTDHTRFAIYITLAGLVVTTVLNILFMPVYGYFASAWSRFFSYMVMIVISYWLGTKYYPIPYDIKSIMLYFVVGLGLFGLSLLLKGQTAWLRLPVNTVLLMLYIGFVLKTEKIRLNSLKSMIPINILKKNRNKEMRE